MNRQSESAPLCRAAAIKDEVTLAVDNLYTSYRARAGHGEGGARG